MFVMFGTNDPEHNTVAFRGVTRIYMSIAPKDDKTKYLEYERIRDTGFIMRPPSKPREDENVKFVYVLEFFDDSEPMVFPTDKFALSVVDENII